MCHIPDKNYAQLWQFLQNEPKTDFTITLSTNRQVFWYIFKTDLIKYQ